MTRKGWIGWRTLAAALPMLAACGAAGDGDGPIVTEAVPNQVEQPVAEPVVTEQPATGPVVTVASRVHGTPPRAEFTVTGPFFEAGGSEPLVLRAVPEEEEGYGAQPAEAGRTFRGRYDFYRGDVLHHSLDDFWTLGLVGSCLLPRSGRLGILVRPWHGGASIPAGLLRLQYDPQAETVGARGFDVMVELPVELDEFAAECGPGQALWGERFVPCPCGGPFEYWLEAGGLMARLTELVVVAGERGDSGVWALAGEEFEAVGGRLAPRLPRVRVPDRILSPLFEEISRFVETEDVPVRDGGHQDLGYRDGLSLARYESPAFTLVAATLSTVDIYGSVQLLWVRSSSGDFWQPLYAADYSRADGFWPASVHGFDSDDTVRLADVCVADCNLAWDPAQRATVAWDLRTLSVRIVGDGRGRQE